VIEDDYQHRYEGFDPNSPESYIIFSLIQNTHKEQSLRFADCLQKEFAKGPIRVNRGVKQGGLLVLWKTTMPAVLTEIGFISNSSDCKILVTQDGQNKVAKNLYNAFLSYKNNVEGINGVNSIVDEQESEEEVLSGEDNASRVDDGGQKSRENVDYFKRESEKKNVDKKLEKIEEDFYAIQILSVNKVLKYNSYDLKGYAKAKYIKVDNLYKYYLGYYKSFSEASKNLQSVREVFKGAFIIHIKNGKIIR
jgi:N-acetylmuramoyl-L-alanine amidase